MFLCVDLLMVFLIMVLVKAHLMIHRIRTKVTEEKSEVDLVVNHVTKGNSNDYVEHTILLKEQIITREPSVSFLILECKQKY